ncbi:hypothetical protein, partial [Planktothrix prolifica]|uniref:hypothetical protein n=1 Tax=Planktothrix prolifica TaxID=54307 RepID=UPI0005C555F7
VLYSDRKSFKIAISGLILAKIHAILLSPPQVTIFTIKKPYFIGKFRLSKKRFQNSAFILFKNQDLKIYIFL